MLEFKDILGHEQIKEHFQNAAMETNFSVVRFRGNREGFEGGTGSLPVADIERKQIHIGSIFIQTN